MKTKKEVQQIVRCWILIVYTVSFWGLFYPNFALTRDICTRQPGFSEWSEEEQEEWMEDGTDHVTMQDLRDGDVRYRSRILEWIQTFWK